MASAVEAEPLVSVAFVESVFVESVEHPVRTDTAAITQKPAIQPTAVFFDLIIFTALMLP
ncbi:hypothetical protein SAZ11_00730 [Streptomyces sp. FXJ1.4098]|nr:hypothetical protein [Streptomyces sp. FXJ1.4098]